MFRKWLVAAMAVAFLAGGLIGCEPQEEVTPPTEPKTETEVKPGTEKKAETATKAGTAAPATKPGTAR